VTISFNDASQAWCSALYQVYHGGLKVSPRGRLTHELPHHAVSIELRRPVVTIRERRLSYRFMATEALWILQGRNDLAFLTAHNARMAEFSDNGAVLAGAYGPRISGQLAYVVDQLVTDPDTRRATLAIWTPNPAPSKDYPCTVAMDFKLRDGRLHAHVFMRSSDVWLGLPYDLFSFSMVALQVTALVNARRFTADLDPDDDPYIVPGRLYVTAASSHVYETDFPAVEALLATDDEPVLRQPEVPAAWWFDEAKLRHGLQRVMDGEAGARWWEVDDEQH